MPKGQTTMKSDYVWKDSYQAAIFETDDVRKCLHAAKASIDTRLHEMQLGNGGTAAEREAIGDALSKLNLIRSELEKGRGPQRALVPTSPQQRTG
jgi:hypothetical protein